MPATDDLDSNEPNDNAETKIGRLVFPVLPSSTTGQDKDDRWMKAVYLYVGHHQRLTGEVKKLAKPLAVIRRRQPRQNAEPDDAEHEDLEIAEIVHYKILFSSRPEPVSE